MTAWPASRCWLYGIWHVCELRPKNWDCRLEARRGSRLCGEQSAMSTMSLCIAGHMSIGSSLLTSLGLRCASVSQCNVASFLPLPPDCLVLVLYSHCLYAWFVCALPSRRRALSGHKCQQQTTSTTLRPIRHLCVLNDKKCDSATCPFGDQICHKIGKPTIRRRRTTH